MLHLFFFVVAFLCNYSKQLYKMLCQSVSPTVCQSISRETYCSEHTTYADWPCFLHAFRNEFLKPGARKLQRLWPTDMRHPGNANSNVKKMELVVNPSVMTQVADLERFADSQVTIEDSMREVIREPSTSANGPLRRDIFQGRYMNHVAFGLGVKNGQRGYTVSRTERCRKYAIQEEANTCILNGDAEEDCCPRCKKEIRDRESLVARKQAKNQSDQANQEDVESDVSSNIFASNDAISSRPTPSPPLPRCVTVLSNTDEEECASAMPSTSSQPPPSQSALSHLPDSVEVLSDKANDVMMSVMESLCEPSTSRVRDPSPTPPKRMTKFSEPVLIQTNLGKWLSKAKARAEKELSMETSATTNDQAPPDSASQTDDQGAEPTQAGPSGKENRLSLETSGTTNDQEPPVSASQADGQEANAAQAGPSTQKERRETSTQSMSESACSSKRRSSPENFTPAFGDWNWDSPSPSPEIFDSSPPPLSPSVIHIDDDDDDNNNNNNDDEDNLQTLLEDPQLDEDELEAVYSRAHLTEDKELLKELIFLFSASTAQFGETIFDIKDWFLIFDAAQGSVSYMLVAEANDGTEVKKFFPNIFTNLKEAFRGGPVHVYFSCKAIFGVAFELKYLGSIPSFPDLSSTSAIGRQQISLTAMARRSVFLAGKNCLGNLLARDVQRINPAEFLYEIYFPCLAHMATSKEKLGKDREEQNRFYGQFMSRKDDYMLILRNRSKHRSYRIAARARLVGMFPAFIQVPWDTPPIPYLLDKLSFGMVRYLNR